MEWARESIIVSAVRKFCTSFAAVIGILLGILLIFVCLTMFSSPEVLPAKSHLTIAPDANGDRALLGPMSPVLLKIDIHGVIGEKHLSYDKVNSLLLDSHDGMLKGNRVQGILLSINSPGGAADDSVGIYRALCDYKKKYNVPIYAFIDGLCASGGMYIACAADKIYATPSSVIGSVGVIMGPLFNFSGLMERYGVGALNLTQGKDKDMMSPYRPWQPGEDASLRNVIAALYHQFVATVLQARPALTHEKLVDEYGAQVYVAETAREYGYIDVANADYAMAIGELANAAQAHGYQVLTIAPNQSFLAELVQNKFALLQGKITHSFPIAPYIDSELSGRFLYLYSP